MALAGTVGGGFLPRGINSATLSEVVERFGKGSTARAKQAELLGQVVAAVKSCSTIKRVLVWGSFVTDKPEPNDLDYSNVVSIDHRDALIAEPHRNFW